MKPLGALLLLLLISSCSNSERGEFANELSGELVSENLLDTSNSQDLLNREENEKDTLPGNFPEVKYQSKVILDSMINEQYLNSGGCNLFFDLMFRNQEIKSQIIKTQLKRDKLSKLNSEFLIAILREFENDDHSELSANKELMPVFKVRSDKLGIIDSWLFLNERTYEKLEIPPAIIDDNIVIELEQGNWGIRTANRSLLKLLNDLEVYLVTNQRIVESKITGFHDHEDECLQYSNFILDYESKSPEEQIYFATNKEIDLSFEDFENETQRIRSFLDKEDCFDCPTNLKEVKVVCNLQNTDLYFGSNVGAAKELANSLDFILFYIEDEVVIPIDLESIDLFGCPCL